MKRILLAFAFFACATEKSAGTPPSPVDVVQKEVDAYNAQNIDAFVAMYAENAVVTRGPEKAVWLQGRQAIRDTYGKLFTKYPNGRVRIAERRVEGNEVVDHEIVTGRGPERPDPWDVGWVRNVVENGLITRVELP
ncbi:MAG TPA: nuclear transport factor 2 family protein [Myxococcales bacterium]|nr:nuclear transport factor 2 family protein [Myxococcales bacterium]